MRNAAPHSAVVLILDGLSPGFLGPYGNTWVDTPAFNQLAAESLLVEHAISDFPAGPVAGQLRSCSGMWDGRHAMCPSPAKPGLLWRQCSEQGIQSTLVCDDPQLAKACTAIGFDKIRSLPEMFDPRQADEISATRFAKLISESLDELQRCDARYCLWIHASTLTQVWDAPAYLVDGLLDEDDPDPPAHRAAPALDLTNDDDPDIRWGLSVLYAAQVMAVDACLSVLIDTLHAAPNCRDALFLLSATHGYPLGEHGWVGMQGNGLYTELLQVPLLIRHPQGRHAMLREQQLCQSPTVYATLAEWLGCGTASANLGAQAVPGPSIERAVSQLGQRLSMRTPAWHAIVDRGSPADAIQLYVKPDDRWDFNEVADRCPEEVALIEFELSKFAQAARRETLDQLGALPDQLRSPSR